MKRIYIQFLLLLLVSTFNIDLQAQRLNIPEKSTIGDEFLIAPDGTYSELRPVLSKNCGCEVADLSFNWSGSFNNAIANENLIRLARKRALKKWYSNQINKVVKPAIDRKFGRTFSNFEEAKNELLIDSERKNIATLSRPLRDKYSRLRSRGFKAKEKHLKELKLLKLREAEIKSGNINNPSLGYIKVQGVYLKDIRSLNSLKSKWTPLFDDFSKNIAETHINNHMYKSIGRGVEPEVIKLKNRHYNSLNTWDRLSLLQFLVHYEEYKKLSSPPYLVPEHINNMFKKFNNIDKATPELIKKLSIKNRTGGFSVFDGRTYYKLLSAYTSPPALPGGEYMAKMEWERLKNQALDKLLNSTSTPKNLSEFLQQEEPDYFGQVVKTSGGVSRIHQNAVAFTDKNGNAFAFITPDEKFFFYTKGKGWFLEGNRFTEQRSYQYYVLDKYNRNSQPITWGIHRAADDLGGFVVDLVGHPNKTISDFAKGIIKIATLDFDIEKTWNTVINADLSDASYIVSTIALGHLSGPKGKGLIPASETPQFQELLAQYAAKTRPAKLTWPEILQLFKKARIFEKNVSSHLKTIYKVSDGYSVFNQVYLKYNGVVSIVDDLIYNSKTGKFLLNESKYGVHNKLTKNQKYIQDAIKAGKSIEVRSKGLFKDVNGEVIFGQGSLIKVSEILRAHSVNGVIDINTLKTLWKK
ncbi:MULTISPECIES: hypothetical protein [Tenacibaculum]|uniref:hypothetical protein n=1 Tax=Tenacibaculum TaxID=104267 RepID=UPI0014301FA2|nr:hypothetical protein [Tenacibaculum mesophilum]KAF9657626.1 hypothetical protein HBA12_10315 [Tenacibaculum mesophilum]